MFPTDAPAAPCWHPSAEIFLLACPTRAGQRIFHSAGLGAMGYGLPMSLPVCIGSNRQRTIHRRRRWRLPIQYPGARDRPPPQPPRQALRAQQRRLRQYPRLAAGLLRSPQIGVGAVTGLTIPDLNKIANSYNIPAVIIPDQANLRAEVRKALDEICAPRLQSYQRPDSSFVSKPLEDLFPFPSREEFLENMIVKPTEE